MTSTLASTTILSLQSSLNKFNSVARLSPSSTQDSEGGTRASESPRKATRSLLNSINGRLEQAEAVVVQREEEEEETKLTINKSFSSSASATKSISSFSSEEGISNLESKFQRTPPSIKSFGTEESWDELSTPSSEHLNQVKQEEEEVVEVGTSMMSVTSLRNSQEEEGLIQEVTRSQSDFSRWLEETMKLAKGDGTSVVDSEEAFLTLNDATREARLGMRSSYLGSEIGLGLLGSPFQFQAPAQGIRSPLSLRSIASESHGEEESVLMRIAERQTEAVEITALETPGKTQIANEIVEIGEMLFLASTVPISNNQRALQRSRITSVVLFVFLSASLLRPYLLVIIDFIEQFGELLDHTPTPVFEEEIFTSNYTETLTSHSPVSIGTPLSYPLIISSALFIILLISIPIAIKLLKSPKVSTIKRSRSRSTSPPPISKTSPSSPILLNPSTVLSTRVLLPKAIELYQAHHYSSAIRLFEEIFNTTVTSTIQDLSRDKSIVMEWIGRSWYRIVRGNRNSSCNSEGEKEEEGEEEGGAGGGGGDEKAMVEAIKAFERSIRLNGGRSSNRISLGRCWFRIGELERARSSLEMGLKKETGEESDQLYGMAREFLGKTLIGLGQLKKGETILRAGQLRDSNSYTLAAFLGEVLVETGTDMVEAKKFLRLAISLRNDYPVVHARLASIATSELSHSDAIHHLQQVIATRETGYHDDTFPLATNSSILGSSPYLRLYFSYPSLVPTTTTARNERISLLKSAQLIYPHEHLISILLWINLRRSILRSEREVGLKSLRSKVIELENRVSRYGERDLEGMGLFAMVLLGLGRQKKAEGVYEEFWKGVGGKGRRIGEVKGGLAFLVLGFYELRKMR